jgi:CBS domain containing-hemolysin-like protein
LPEVGDEWVSTQSIGELRLEVLELDGRRIAKLRVERRPPASDQDHSVADAA